MRRRKRRNKWLWLIPVLLVLGLGGGYAYYQNIAAVEEETNTEPELQTATVRRGEILISATGAGTIIPANTTDIAFTTSGTLSELNVQVGDRVAVGDVVAQLENSDLQKAIADAELAVMQAELQLDEDGLARTVELAEIQVRLAELSLSAAQESLDELLDYEPEEDSIAIAQAELNLRNAQNNLQRVYNNADSSDLSLQQAQLNLNTAQNDLNVLRQQGADDGSLDLQQAQLGVQTAQRALDELVNWTADWDEVKVLQANYQSAQQNLASAQSQAGLSDESIVSARVSLDQATLSLADAQAAYDSAYDPAREWESLSHDCKTANAQGVCQQTFSEAMRNERESAERSLERAKQNLEVAQANYDIAVANSGNSTAIASAQSNVASAEKALKDAQEGPTAVDIQSARDALYSAQLALQRTQDGVVDGTTSYNNSVSSAQTQVQQQGLQVQIAQQNASLADANYSTDVVAAQISVQQAQLSLEQTQDGLVEESAEITSQLSAAQRSVEQAELALRQAQINLLETGDTAQAELSLRQAQINLENAISKAEQIMLVSPVAGVVTLVSAQVGASVGTTAIVSVSDLDQTVVEIYFDETDINNVLAGNDVEIIFDALPEEAFTGSVTLVDPQLVINSGLTTVRALAVLDEELFSSGGQLTVGMNATVEVIGGRADNALIVPIEALRELSPGSFSVFVMEDGEPRLRIVEVGLQDFAFAEIVSGVEQGDVVTTGIVETQ